MTRHSKIRSARKPLFVLAAVVVASLAVLASSQSAAAAPTWHFPWSYGDTARVSCGYGCYYHGGASYYGLDFNWGTGWNADCGRSVLAVGNGYVTRSSCSDWLAETGYGCHVEVWHAGGQRSFYAHLRSGSGASRRTNVCLGWRIGRVGDSGRGASTCHLHFHMTKQGNAYKPEPMFGRRSGQSGCRKLTGLGVGSYVSCTGWGCHNPE